MAAPTANFLDYQTSYRPKREVNKKKKCVGEEEEEEDQEEGQG